ncbi:MAG: DUF2806 domain-containing protein [Amaricoccus sp.]|uniref:DUF2806 domain-containing protein n=1 Tax=Amaricoccus sp. TaxID=1872485 RepID=UPI003314CE75
MTQKKSKIDAQTESYKLVEMAIAQAAASGAGADPATVHRAMTVLVRNEYRKQQNRDAVAAAMVEDMREYSGSAAGGDSLPPLDQLDDDWLNVFERYADDASSERLQGLWGRVLAGQIRRPGRFSSRTLRFLSEFSQADALTFEAFAKGAFGNAAPTKVAHSAEQDIRDLIYLESSGLIQGASGGLQQNITFDMSGVAVLSEGDLRLIFKAEPNYKLSYPVISLTPLGQELLGLVASRDPREAARTVARAMRNVGINEAYLGVAHTDGQSRVVEVLWLMEDPNAPAVDGATG